MIYVLISGEKAYTKTEKCKKRDCRILRQPLNLLPKETREYIENTKNENVRLERRLAYTSLFLGLKEFFGVENAEVRKTENGKPYLVINGIGNKNQKTTNSAQKKEYQKNEDFDFLLSNDQNEKNTYQQGDYTSTDCPALPCSDECYKKIYVSISHSDGVSAVCLSDEGEVGIDIQSEIDSSKVERLNKRFFPALKPLHADLNVEYCFCDIGEEKVCIEPADMVRADLNSDTAKWAWCESLIKLSGGGFGDLKLIENISENSLSELKAFVEKRKFTIAVSKVK